MGVAQLSALGAVSWSVFGGSTVDSTCLKTCGNYNSETPL